MQYRSAQLAGLTFMHLLQAFILRPVVLQLGPQHARASLAHSNMQHNELQRKMCDTLQQPWLFYHISIAMLGTLCDTEQQQRALGNEAWHHMHALRRQPFVPGSGLEQLLLSLTISSVMKSYNLSYILINIHFFRIPKEHVPC